MPVLAVDTSSVAVPKNESAGREARLRALFEANFDFIWRLLRRLGVAEAGVDDAAQEVFLLAARKLDHIEADSERAYLFSTAQRVAANTRRSVARRPEMPDSGMDTAEDPIPGADELSDQKKARELMDQVLSSLPMDLRSVLVLYECEGMTLVEIAETTGLPQGTVASRLRRARAEFDQVVGRIMAMRSSRRGRP